jgi:hypothetical protein
VPHHYGTATLTSPQIFKLLDIENICGDTQPHTAKDTPHDLESDHAYSRPGAP